MSVFGLTILIALLIGFLADTLVVLVDLRATPARPPEKVSGFIDDAVWEKSMAYARAKAWLDIVASGSKLVALLLWWFLGGFAWLDRMVASWKLGEIASGVLYVAILLVAFKLFSQPFKIYHTFVLEARFGFNRTSWNTFIDDRAKGLLLSLVIGGPLLVTVLVCFHYWKAWAWLYCWLIATFFLILIQYIAPAVLMPLFNRYTPLPEGSLKRAIEACLEKAGVKFSGIFTVDGSRRSTRANAFVTGLGAQRRVVLYDTLLLRQPEPEVVAVLAHEIGHLVLDHLRRVTLITIPYLGLMCGLLSLAMQQPDLHRDFFMERVTLHGGFVFFVLLAVPVDVITGPFFKRISRAHELAADRFAATTLERPEALASALKQLAVANLTQVNPHPWRVFLHHAHPAILTRIAAIEALQDPEKG
ncbi:Protease HtpX [Candidatus Magnetaquicoccaceae bacterium FCR-1]|uniref:Protease HtpX n=1 Tax=Candidatus Magnetaquiglobus chichijimensis TaxID=3141448 RepID=A0ABQ0C4P7_9PROT